MNDSDTIDAVPARLENQRERAKAERRQRIIAATRDLIRETGEAGLSMRALAARAGVSLATPYNLFGSKGAIVVAAIDDIKDYRARLESYRDVDPVERLFLAIDIAVEYYLKDPDFYRVVWSAMGDSEEVRAGIYSNVRSFWRKLASDVVTAGAVRLDTELLYRQLERIFHAAMLDWVAGEVSDDLLSAEMQLGFALILAGTAHAEWSGPLQNRIRRCEARLRGNSRPRA